MDFGSASSAVPMSFENRFMIRPDGFRLKNLIGVDIKARNIVSCKFCEAIAQKRKNVMDLVKVIINNDAMIPPYIYVYISVDHVFDVNISSVV